MSRKLKAGLLCLAMMGQVQTFAQGESRGARIQELQGAKPEGQTFKPFPVRSFQSVMQSLEDLRHDLSQYSKSEKLLLNSQTYEQLKIEYPTLPKLSEVKIYLNWVSQDLDWLFKTLPSDVSKLVSKGVIEEHVWWSLPVQTRNFLKVSPFEVELPEFEKKKISPLEIYFFNEIFENEHGKKPSMDEYLNSHLGLTVEGILTFLKKDFQKEKDLKNPKEWLKEVWQKMGFQNKFRFLVSKSPEFRMKDMIVPATDPGQVFIFNPSHISEYRVGKARAEKVFGTVSSNPGFFNFWLTPQGLSENQIELNKIRRAYVQNLFFYANQTEKKSFSYALAKELLMILVKGEPNLLNPKKFKALTAFETAYMAQRVKTLGYNIYKGQNKPHELQDFFVAQDLMKKITHQFCQDHQLVEEKDSAVNPDAITDDLIKKSLIDYLEKYSKLKPSEIQSIMSKNFREMFQMVARKFYDVNWVYLPKNLQAYPKEIKTHFQKHILELVLDDPEMTTAEMAYKEAFAYLNNRMVENVFGLSQGYKKHFSPEQNIPPETAKVGSYQNKMGEIMHYYLKKLFPAAQETPRDAFYVSAFRSTQPAEGSTQNRQAVLKVPKFKAKSGR